MKKYIFSSIFILSVIFTLYKMNLKNKNSHITGLMLKNIECLATPENTSTHCFGYGTVDCPKNKEQSLFYF